MLITDYWNATCLSLFPQNLEVVLITKGKMHIKRYRKTLKNLHMTNSWIIYPLAVTHCSPGKGKNIRVPAT